MIESLPPPDPGRSPGSRRRRRSALATWRRLARLNHILIPAKKEDRDRLRRTLVGKTLGVFVGTIEAYSREGRVLLGLGLLVGCSSLDARFSQGHQLFAMLLGLLLASLLVRPWFRVRDLKVEVQAPSRVAAGSRARFDIVLSNRGTTPLFNLRVDRPFLPWDGKWLEALGGVGELRPGDQLRIPSWARFIARGEHHLDHFEVGALVPLGLAVGPRRRCTGTRFLVVPRVANVVSVRVAHRLPEQRGTSISTLHPGDADIAGVRPYRPGDELKHLHARTWARTGTPHVRQYVDERFDSVALAVLVDGPFPSESAREATLSLAAGVAARLTLHEGGVDGLLIDDHWFSVEPRAGERALDRILDRLSVHQLSKRQCAFEAALDERLAGLSMLVLVTVGTSTASSRAFARARERGIPCRWAIVSEPGNRPAPVPVDAVVVHAADVEDGVALAL